MAKTGMKRVGGEQTHGKEQGKNEKQKNNGQPVPEIQNKNKG